MNLKGKKQYKVEHFEYSCFVTIEIDWDSNDIQSKVNDMSQFWSDCPDGDSNYLTEDNIDYFLRVTAARVIRRLSEEMLIGSPEIANKIINKEEGFFEFGDELGIKIIDVEGLYEMISSDFNVEVIED